MSTGLAYAGIIQALHPIENADRLELAMVDCQGGGQWSGVVAKGQFLAGQGCVAILQDAVVPQTEEFDFLKKQKYRVKMLRLRGVPSECVIVPLPAGSMPGDDVTEQLGIQKYEKVLHGQIAGDELGQFPSFIPKTDEPNFQTARRLIRALYGRPYVVTVKADGSSGTAYRKGDHFGVCSRRLELKEGNDAYWQVAKRYSLRDRLDDGLALQFEVVGPGIQKNPLGLKEVDGLGFNVWSMKDHDHLPFRAAEKVFNDLGMSTVEHFSSFDSFTMSDDEMRSLAESITYPNGSPAEGIVIRALDGSRHLNERISFKVINLKYKD